MNQEIFYNTDRNVRVTYSNFWYRVEIRSGYKWVKEWATRDRDAALNSANR